MSQGGPGNGDGNASEPTLILPSRGPGRLLVAGADIPVPGWEVVDSFVARFAPGLALDHRFADTVTDWESVPTRVVYAVVDGRDVLVGLSYQTQPVEILHAVWTGFCVALARALRNNDIAVVPAIESDHPGAAVLVDRLARLVGVADLRIDRAVRHVAAAARVVRP